MQIYCQTQAYAYSYALSYFYTLSDTILYTIRLYIQEAVSIHGGKDQAERNEAIRLYKEGKNIVYITV